MNNKCIFCNVENSKIITQNEDFTVINSKFPKDEVHLLIIPKKCIKTYFEENNSQRALNPFYETKELKPEEEEKLNILKKELQKKLLEYAQDQIKKENLISATFVINFYPPYAQVPHAHAHIIGHRKKNN